MYRFGGNMNTWTWAKRLSLEQSAHVERWWHKSPGQGRGIRLAQFSEQRGFIHRRKSLLASREDSFVLICAERSQSPSQHYFWVMPTPAATVLYRRNILLRPLLPPSKLQVQLCPCPVSQLMSAVNFTVESSEGGSNELLPRAYQPVATSVTNCLA